MAALACRSHARLAPRATLALVAVLRALDLPPGSEVLMPVMLCANAANAIRWAGLRPLFADISQYTLNLDLDKASGRVGPRTKVILAVPLFGNPLDVSKLLEFAKRYNLIIIEDAAQAVGLRHINGEPAGSVGLCSVYSFATGKIADAGGGAALLSDDLAFLERAHQELARFPSGQTDLNRQTTAIRQALDQLSSELETRAQLSDLYRHELQSPNIIHTQIKPGSSLWKYNVLLPNRNERDRITRALLAEGIPATNLYPPLSHFFQNARPDSQNGYPVAWDVFNRIVNLPLWPEPQGVIESVTRAFRIK